MSLILDALRKSEAERRRGQSPSLYSASPVPTTRARPIWLRWLPLVALAVLAVVALFVWRGEPGPATKDELAAGASAPAAEDVGENADALATQPADDFAASASAPAPATAPPPPAQSAAPAPTVDALVKPAAAPPESTAPPPSPSLVAAPTPAPPAQAPAESAPAASEAPVEQLPPLAVLDAGTRSGLPAMKLSMHVYGNDSAHRFAIIDGQRVTEGSRIGSATVAEIRRDGVVLDVGGRRVLLPRP